MVDLGVDAYNPEVGIDPILSSVYRKNKDNAARKLF